MKAETESAGRRGPSACDVADRPPSLEESVKLRCTGGPGATEALADLILRVAGQGQPLESVLSGFRTYYAEGTDALVIEPGIPADRQAALRARGHTLHPANSGARINVIYCETGVPSDLPSCAAFADPRGFGLGAVGDG